MPSVPTGVCAYVCVCVYVCVCAHAFVHWHPIQVLDYSKLYIFLFIALWNM
jgi:hypothetical protein